MSKKKLQWEVQYEFHNKLDLVERNELWKKIAGIFLQVQGYKDSNELADAQKEDEMRFFLLLQAAITSGQFFSPLVTMDIDNALAKAWDMPGGIVTENMTLRQMGFYISLFDIRSPLGNTLSGTAKDDGDTHMTFWNFPIHIDSIEVEK